MMTQRDLTCEDIIFVRPCVIFRYLFCSLIALKLVGQNVLGSSLEVLSNPWQSSAIFLNVRKRSSGLRTTFIDSMKIFGKWSKNFGKSPKTSLCVIILKENNGVTWKYEISLLVLKTLEDKFRSCLRAAI